MFPKSWGEAIKKFTPEEKFQKNIIRLAARFVNFNRILLEAKQYQKNEFYTYISSINYLIFYYQKP
jgi:hypothetical protein